MERIELDPIPIESGFSEKKLAYKIEGRMKDKSSKVQSFPLAKKTKKIRRDISASLTLSARR